MGSEPRMIKLHRVYGQPLYVNIEQICAVYETDNGTTVEMLNKSAFLVRETPELILRGEV